MVYVFSGTDPEYERNLHFFIENGIEVSLGLQGCHAHPTSLLGAHQSPLQPSIAVTSPRIFCLHHP